MIKQTAGRDQLGEFAPKFAELNDDILFGEVWSREGVLSLKTRSILTVTVLVSKGLIDSSFQYHLASVHSPDQQLHLHGILAPPSRKGAPLHESKERDLYNWRSTGNCDYINWRSHHAKLSGDLETG